MRDSELESVIGVVLVAGFAAVGAIVLRLGFHRSWGEVTLAIGCFVAIMIAMFASAAFVRKRKWSRIGVAIMAICLWAEIALAAYFAWCWDLLPAFGRSDLWLFLGLTGAITLAVTLAPRRWLEHAQEPKCRRCGHYHEGRDCTCGCRVDQFKYPPFQAP